jgi:hypothetical protein
MTTIDIFSIFDLNKNQNVTEMKKNKSIHLSNQNDTPSLNQGGRFKTYQQKIKKHLEKDIYKVNSKEGFEPMNMNMNDKTYGGKLTKETRNVLSNTNISSKKKGIDDLQGEYQKTIDEYESSMAQITGSANNYLTRVNPNNPYLGKNIQIGKNIMYVTNQGVAKLYPDQTILQNTAGQNGCPASSQIIQTNISWSSSYASPGVTIPTKPQLVTGTPMTSGQSCGNEGTNVFVNEMLGQISSEYVGCYQDNQTSPLMTFIGASAPPPVVNIQNGNFSQPQIASNSYQYINSSSTVPGWDFNVVLINNSQAWGYPMPYPNGSQAASIQMTGSMSQAINLITGVTYVLSFQACGRNCCDGTGTSNPINIQLNSNTINTLNAGNTWSEYSVSFTAQQSGTNTLSFTGTSSTDRSTAFQNIQITNSESSTGTFSYSQCQQAAANSGYQYFALQDVNSSTGLGYCGVSNNEPTVTSLGTSTVISGETALWASNTSGQPGNTAILNVSGSLSVLNSGGSAVFNTPGNTQIPSSYLGCYGDSSNRAMTGIVTGESQQYNLQECQQIAQQSGSAYYGLQNSTSGTTAQCFLSNNLAQTMSYGNASNCTQISDGSWSGGGWSNAVYQTTMPQSNYFLILQDDGNMCVYRGSGPNDNQGNIWASGTNGQQQQETSAYAASNGKYGQNWIPSGSTLAAGDFVGSTNGSMALIMQSDGNLVLYTFTTTTNCQRMSGGQMGGGIGANALYNIGQKGISNNMMNLAYIDQNAELHPYPSTNTNYKNKYTTYNNTNVTGSDIQGAAIGDTTVSNCESLCNSNKNCAGFVFQEQGNVCMPKTSGIVPISNSQPESGYTTYYRNLEPKSTPIGVQNTTNNINTIQYQNYINGGNLTSTYGLAASITNTQKQQLSKAQQKMKLLSGKLTNVNNSLNQDNTQVTNQTLKNMKGLDNYVENMEDTTNKISGLNKNMNNINNIVDDSDITVLQQNYNYIFWSILATGTIIVSMNILK